MQRGGALAVGRHLREHGGEGELRVDHPRPRTHPLVHRQRGLEPLDRLVAAPEQIGEQAEVT